MIKRIVGILMNVFGIFEYRTLFKTCASPCLSWTFRQLVRYFYNNLNPKSSFFNVLDNFQMFLSVPGYFRHNPEAERDVKSSTSFLMSLQTSSGDIFWFIYSLCHLYDILLTFSLSTPPLFKLAHFLKSKSSNLKLRLWKWLPLYFNFFGRS